MQVTDDAVRAAMTAWKDSHQDILHGCFCGTMANEPSPRGCEDRMREAIEAALPLCVDTRTTPN